jgi:hypothetical protein
MLVLRGIKHAFCIPKQVLSSLVAYCRVEVDLVRNAELLRQFFQLLLMLYVLRYFEVVAPSYHKLYLVFSLLEFGMR